MLDQLVESSTVRRKSSRWMCFGVTAILWVFILTAIVIVGVFTFDARLNDRFESITLLTPSPLAPPPPGVAPASTKRDAQPGFLARQDPPRGISPPSLTPPAVGPVIGPGGPDGVPPGGFVDGTGSWDVRWVPGGSGSGEAPPPPERSQTMPRPAPETGQPLPVSGRVLLGKAINRVSPTYPELAKRAGVFGICVVEITVDEGGRVILARAVSGHPLLKDAAASAARQWRFTPTLLSNVPVRVIGTITFNFKL